MIGLPPYSGTLVDKPGGLSSFGCGEACGGVCTEDPDLSEPDDWTLMGFTTRIISLRLGAGCIDKVISRWSLSPRSFDTVRFTVGLIVVRIAIPAVCKVVL